MSLALLDTCVLYPRYLRDVLLNMAEDELYAPLWSAEILTELRRNLACKDDPANVDGMIGAVRHAFPDAEVIDFEHLTPTMTNHPKDRHVLAAAVYAEADLLVTANLKDFPRSLRGLRVVSPDAFLLSFDPDAVITTLRRTVKDYRRPPMDLAGLLEALEATVPGFVGVVKELTS